jgi:aspartate/methionine/tyrosine aminotransferase
MPLREKIADYLTAVYKVSISPNQLFISHGSMGGLSAIFLSLLNPGDEVIIPTPTYPVYSNAVKLVKAKPVFIDTFFLKKQSDGKVVWEFDVSRIREVITSRSRMIIIPNPSNPLGVCFTKEQLQALKDICEEHKMYLVSDEVYENYVFEGQFNSVINLMPESKYIFRVGSFSKNFAMSGWRVGFVVVPPDMIETFSAVQSATICCPTVVSQYAALYALDHNELMNDQIKTIKQNLDFVVRSLKPLVDRGILSYAIPQSTFYLFAKTAEQDSEQLVMDILQKVKVALAPGKDFGPGHESCFRLCFARDPQLVQEGITRLLNYFDTLYVGKTTGQAKERTFFG